MYSEGYTVCFVLLANLSENRTRRHVLVVVGFLIIPVCCFVTKFEGGEFDINLSEI